MSNYQADRGLQNDREDVLRRNITVRRKENTLFRHVFQDLRVDWELGFY